MGARVELKHGLEPGFTMPEVMAALVVMMLLMSSVFDMWERGASDVRQAAVARHFMAVAQAMERYVELRHETLLAQTTKNSGPVITFEDLREAHCLSALVSERNGWGQGYGLTVRLDEQTGQLAAVVITVGGQGADESKPAFAQITVPAAAALAKAGFIPVDEPGIIQGAFGAWAANLAELGLAAEPGHLATVSVLARETQKSGRDFLYRVGVPGQPELNRMETSLDMTGHSLTGLGGLRFEGQGDATAPCDVADEGQLKLDPSNGLYVCRGGKTRLVSDTGNSLSFQRATLAVDGQMVNKPACPVPGTYPEIFVTQSIVSPVEGPEGEGSVEAMHSVQGWATSESDTQWQVHLRALIYGDGGSAWVRPGRDYGRVVVFTTCTGDE